MGFSDLLCINLAFCLFAAIHLWLQRQPRRVFVINVGFRPFPIVGERLQSRAKFGGLSLVNSPRPQVNVARLKVVE